MASPTAQQSPVVNPTKQEIQWTQLQWYFLGFVSSPLQVISAQNNARAQTRMVARTHNLIPPMEPLVMTILHVNSLISNDIFYTDGYRQWR